MWVGFYVELLLVKVCEIIKLLLVCVFLGYDVVGEKKECKVDVLVKIEFDKNVLLVFYLVMEYFEC